MNCAERLKTTGAAISTAVIAATQLVVALFLAASPLSGQSVPSLAERIHKVMSRPEFRHARFGIEFFSMDTGQPIFTLNQNELFVPGSTTKLLTEGTVLESFGGDYRFHTRVYHTGQIKSNGTLDGDLILLASGDPNLSGRIQPDGTLGFEDEDHSYGGPDSKGLPGDPLLVIRELAQQVAAKNIKRVKGHVLVDASLFPEGEHELGTHVVLSPIVVNDNVVDVLVSPGATEGAAVNLQISPKTAYVKFVNQATTGKPGSKSQIRYSDKTDKDGTVTVTVSGTYPLGPSTMRSFAVPEPSVYAAVLLVEALREKGVDAKTAPYGERPDFKTLSANYKPENVVAEHVSPPLKEDVRITLKVSQNLHASMGPFLLGSLLARSTEDVAQAGFDLERNFLTKAGLDLTGAMQSDGAGGDAYFTPDFMIHYLLFMSKQKDFADFHRSLPILGRDGTLVKIQVNSPAAGHVHAKTGTFGTYDALNRRMLVTGKGLAGYMDTQDGRHLALALYANMVSVSRDDPDAVQTVVGQALGEIAAAAYDAPAEPGPRTH